ncbi:MAG: hypothetical protein JNK31_07670 [Candidatus Competibacter sp.]|nr:hypothetical protein [Candidatus Competibacter sp.]
MDALGPIEQATARQAIQRLESTAQQVISKELRGSVNQRFPKELLQKTLQEIYKGASTGDDACITAKKLLNDLRFKK